MSLHMSEPVSAIAVEPNAAIPSPEKGSAAAGPHHLELTYVYEVDAVEMPELDSQVVPEDEPSISISAGMAETLDDEVLPFEARPAAEKSEVRVRVRSRKRDPALSRSDSRSCLTARDEVEVKGGDPGRTALSTRQLRQSKNDKGTASRTPDNPGL